MCPFARALPWPGLRGFASSGYASLTRPTRYPLAHSRFLPPPRPSPASGGGCRTRSGPSPLAGRVWNPFWPCPLAGRVWNPFWPSPACGGGCETRFGPPPLAGEGVEPVLALPRLRGRVWEGALFGHLRVSRRLIAMMPRHESSRVPPFRPALRSVRIRRGLFRRRRRADVRRADGMIEQVAVTADLWERRPRRDDRAPRAEPARRRRREVVLPAPRPRRLRAAPLVQRPGRRSARTVATSRQKKKAPGEGGTRGLQGLDPVWGRYRIHWWRLAQGGKRTSGPAQDIHCDRACGRKVSGMSKISSAALSACLVTLATLGHHMWLLAMDCNGRIRTPKRMTWRNR